MQTLEPEKIQKTQTLEEKYPPISEQRTLLLIKAFRNFILVLAASCFISTIAGVIFFHQLWEMAVYTTITAFFLHFFIYFFFLFLVSQGIKLFKTLKGTSTFIYVISIVYLLFFIGGGLYSDRDLFTDFIEVISWTLMPVIFTLASVIQIAWGAIRRLRIT